MAIFETMNSSGSSGGSVNVSGIYNAAPPALANGQTSQLQLDSQGDLKVYNASLGYGEDATNNVLGVAPKIIANSTYSPTMDLADGTITHTSKNTAGNVLSFVAQSTQATALFFQVWNGATAGAGTLIDLIKVPAGSATVPGFASKNIEDYGANGLYASTAITWGWSSTATTYTAASSGTGLTTSLGWK